MKAKLLLFLSVLSISLGAAAQEQVTDSPGHVYKVNYVVSGSFCLIAIAADIYAIPTIIKSKQDLTDKELDAINPDVLSGFDRLGLEQDPSQRNAYYKTSDYALPVIITSA